MLDVEVFSINIFVFFTNMMMCYLDPIYSEKNINRNRLKMIEQLTLTSLSLLSLGVKHFFKCFNYIKHSYTLSKLLFKIDNCGYF